MDSTRHEIQCTGYSECIRIVSGIAGEVNNCNLNPWINMKREIITDWKRIANPFKWKPLEERFWRFGPPLLPEIPDPRRPEYYLDYQAKEEIEQYFVNVSDETLLLVRSDSGGFESLDEDVLTIQSPIYEYKGGET